MSDEPTTEPASPTTPENRARAQASRFGAAVRARRKGLGLTQDQLAIAAGVGRRFIIDLEAGKASSELGRALVVAEALNISLFTNVASEVGEEGVDLPDLLDDAAS